jgi:hypothetical protein
MRPKNGAMFADCFVKLVVKASELVFVALMMLCKRFTKVYGN